MWVILKLENKPKDLRERRSERVGDLIEVPPSHCSFSLSLFLFLARLLPELRKPHLNAQVGISSARLQRAAKNTFTFEAKGSGACKTLGSGVVTVWTF